MLKKHIISCLDVKDGHVVGGVNFVNLTNTSNLVDAACVYYEAGCDELVFLDITAIHEKRGTTVKMAKHVADQIFVPSTVGGGIRPVEDMSKILKASVDKVAVNSSAVASPQLVKDYVERFGNQYAVSAINARKEADGAWHVYVADGREDTGIDLTEWAETVVSLGAGEILLTGIDKDGTKSGSDLDMLNAVVDVVNAPIIASGSVRNTDHMVDVSGKTTTTGALAASIFHSGEVSTIDTEAAMAAAGTEVRQ